MADENRSPGFETRFAGDLELMRSEEFRARCRAIPTAFTRNRLLTAPKVLGSVVSKRGKSMALDLRYLHREGLLETEVSCAAFSKARDKLDPLALRELGRHHAWQFYHDGGYRTWHGLVLCGIDGSSADVDTNPATLERWGNASNPGARPQAQVGISQAYDPINRQVFDVSIGRCALDERAEVPGHLEVVREAVGDVPLLATMDRGYPSIELIADLAAAGVHFLMRCPKSFLPNEFAACGAAGGDLVVDVELTADRLGRMRAKGREDDARALLERGTLRLRLVLVDIGGDEPERLVTDLPGPDSAGPAIAPVPGVDPLTRDDLKDGYHLRWGSETCYRFEKEPLELENLSGRKPHIIEQDIYATFYLTNLAFDLADAAERELVASGGLEGHKHAMTVNRTYAIGALVDELARAIACEDDAERARIMRGLVEELKRHLVPVRPGKPRKGRKKKKRSGKGKGKKRRRYYNYRKAI